MQNIDDQLLKTPLFNQSQYELDDNRPTGGPVSGEKNRSLEALTPEQLKKIQELEYLEQLDYHTQQRQVLLDNFFHRQDEVKARQNQNFPYSKQGRFLSQDNKNLRSMTILQDQTPSIDVKQYQRMVKSNIRTLQNKQLKQSLRQQKLMTHELQSSIASKKLAKQLSQSQSQQLPMILQKSSSQGILQNSSQYPQYGLNGTRKFKMKRGPKRQPPLRPVFMRDESQSSMGPQPTSEATNIMLNQLLQDPQVQLPEHIHNMAQAQLLRLNAAEQSQKFAHQPTDQDLYIQELQMKHELHIHNTRNELDRTLAIINGLRQQNNEYEKQFNNYQDMKNALCNVTQAGVRLPPLQRNCQSDIANGAFTPLNSTGFNNVAEYHPQPYSEQQTEANIIQEISKPQPEEDQIMIQIQQEEQIKEEQPQVEQAVEKVIALQQDTSILDEDRLIEQVIKRLQERQQPNQLLPDKEQIKKEILQTHQPPTGATLPNPLDMGIKVLEPLGECIQEITQIGEPPQQPPEQEGEHQPQTRSLDDVIQSIHQFNQKQPEVFPPPIEEILKKDAQTPQQNLIDVLEPPQYIHILEGSVNDPLISRQPEEAEVPVIVVKDRPNQVQNDKIDQRSVINAEQDQRQILVNDVHQGPVVDELNPAHPIENEQPPELQTEETVRTQIEEIIQDTEPRTIEQEFNDLDLAAPLEQKNSQESIFERAETEFAQTQKQQIQESAPVIGETQNEDEQIEQLESMALQIRQQMDDIMIDEETKQLEEQDQLEAQILQEQQDQYMREEQDVVEEVLLCTPQPTRTKGEQVLEQTIQSANIISPIIEAQSQLQVPPLVTQSVQPSDPEEGTPKFKPDQNSHRVLPSLRKPKKIVVVDDKKKEEIKQALNNYGFEEIAQENANTMVNQEVGTQNVDMVGDIAKKMDEFAHDTSEFGNGPDQRTEQATSQVCTTPLPSLQAHPKNLNDIDLDLTQDVEKGQMQGPQSISAEENTFARATTEQPANILQLVSQPNSESIMNSANKLSNLKPTFAHSTTLQPNQILKSMKPPSQPKPPKPKKAESGISSYNSKLEKKAKLRSNSRQQLRNDIAAKKKMTDQVQKQLLAMILEEMGKTDPNDEEVVRELTIRMQRRKKGVAFEQ